MEVRMLKIVILLLIIPIIYFILRTRKGMSKVDAIFNKENEESIKQLQLQIQKKLDENKVNKKK